MDINERIKELMDERDWSPYMLAKESGISGSTISNLFLRNSVPGFATLEAICNGLGITLAQFFATDNLVELSDEQLEMFKMWAYLSREQKQLLLDQISLFYKSAE